MTPDQAARTLRGCSPWRVGRIVKQRRRRSLAAERPIVAHIDPKPAGARLRLGEHLHGRVVDMQALGGEHVPAKLGEDGVEGCDASADPVSERRDVELDALAGEGCALPVQRQMVAELADQDHGEQARAGKAAWDRMRRRRRLADRLAVPTGELFAHPLDDLPAPRLAFERLGHHLAELAQPRAAALAADARGGLDDALDRQIVRKLAGAARRAPPRRLGGLRAPRSRPWPLPRPASLPDPRSPVRAARRGACRVPTTGRRSRGAPWPIAASAARSPGRELSLRSALARAAFCASVSRCARIIACALARSSGRASGRPSTGCSRGLVTTTTRADSAAKVACETAPESIGRSHPAAVGRQVFCGIRQSMPDRR